MPGQGGEDSQVEANEAAGASRKEQSLGPAHRTASTQDTHPSENHQETPRETLESPFQPGCYSTVRHSEDSANSFHTILFAAWHLRPSLPQLPVPTTGRADAHLFWTRMQVKRHRPQL